MSRVFEVESDRPPHRELPEPLTLMERRQMVANLLENAGSSLRQAMTYADVEFGHEICQVAFANDAMREAWLNRPINRFAKQFKDGIEPQRHADTEPKGPS